MSVTATRWSSSTNTFNRYKTSSSSKNKNSLLGDNVKNYPHRESLVKKSSPYKASNNGSMLSSMSLDSTIVNKTLKNLPRSGTSHLSSELVSELSLINDSPSKAGGSVTTTNTAANSSKSGKRGSLLAPFMFMTSELEDNKMQHYNKGHLETVLKQLDLLQCLVVTKHQEDRHDNETQLMKAWMAVNEKEEEAFTISIKERTVDEVHNVHNRLVEMEKSMEVVCESLAPTFEKFASFNELKLAQKETENYVKSIKKFNIRTKINQEYSERILKLEKSIDFLERTNEKNNRMVRTPIIQQVKRIDSAISLRPSSPTDSVQSNNSFNKKLNRSASWTSNRALEMATSKSMDSTDLSITSDMKKSSPAKSTALELEVPPNKAENNKTSTAASSSTMASSSTSANNLHLTEMKSPSGKPPIPFQERVLRPSWAKEEVPVMIAAESSPKTERLSFQERILRPTSSSLRSEPVVDEANTTSGSNTSLSSHSTSSTTLSNTSMTNKSPSEFSSSTISIAPPASDLAAIAMGLGPASESTATINKTSEEKKEGLTVMTSSAVGSANHSNSSSVAGSPSISAGKQKSWIKSPPKELTTSETTSNSTTNNNEEGPNHSTTTTTSRTYEKVIVEKKVLSRASWLHKDNNKTEEAASSSSNNLTSSTGSFKPSPFPETGLPSSVVQLNSLGEMDNGNNNSSVGKMNRSIYLPKPDSKLPPPADMPQSTVVKSIASQINTSKTLNASFYEKKLQQSGSPSSSFVNSLPKIFEDFPPPAPLPAPVELKSEQKKSWKELAEPVSYLPVPPSSAPPVPASIASILLQEETPSTSRGHRRTPSNGSSNSSHYSEVESILVVETGAASQLHLEGSKAVRENNDFSSKSWREISGKSRSNSNETAQVSTNEPVINVKKEEGIAIRAAANYSAERVTAVPSPTSPGSAFKSRGNGGNSFTTLTKQEEITETATTTSTTLRPTTPKFQPKLNTTSFSEVTVSQPAVTATVTASPFATAAAAGTPPRITGSRGLISAIALNKQKAEATAGTSITNTAPVDLIPAPGGSPKMTGVRQPTNFNTMPPIPDSRNLPASSTRSSSSDLRNSLDLRVTNSQIKTGRTSNNNSQKAPSSAASSNSSNHNMKELEMDMEETPTVFMSRPSSSAANNNNKESTSYAYPNQIRPPSAASGSNDEMETGSAMSGVTMDSKISGSGKKKRLTVKGVVKRVNSLFGMNSNTPKVEETTTTVTTATITEQNLTKQQLSFVQEKKQSFIEKKIDANTTIVTNTPVIKPTNNEIDFSFIEHITGDDVSSVDHNSEDQHMKSSNHSDNQNSNHNNNNDLINAVTANSGTVQSGSGEVSHQSKDSKTFSKRISGLVKKTSSMFMKLSGSNAPEPPPRPENLPTGPLKAQNSSSTPNTSEKKLNGIAVLHSDSFDAPATITRAEVMEKAEPVRPVSILKNGPNQNKEIDRSLPVDTQSLGTIDKLIQQQMIQPSDVNNNSQKANQQKQQQQQQMQQQLLEEESSVTNTDDKFDGTGAAKPKKFKPVKFLKKTFTSMGKMI